MSGQSRSGGLAPITAVWRISRRTAAAALALGGSFSFAGTVQRTSSVQIGLTAVCLTSDLERLRSLRACLSLAMDRDVEQGLPPIAAPWRRSQLPPNSPLANAFRAMVRLDGLVAREDALFDTIVAKAERVRRGG